MGHIYPTKVDWWIAGILIFSVAVLVASATPFFVGAPARSPLGLAIGVSCLVLAVWMGRIPFNTNYEIRQTELLIRSAGFRWRVPLDSITEVAPTHNPLSSPACSLDRLRVRYHRKGGRPAFVLISPREKEEFLEELSLAVPELVRVEHRLKRVDHADATG